MRNLLTTLRKFTIYQTPTTIFISGANEQLTHFRLLRINRLEALKLAIEEDKTHYDRESFKTKIDKELSEDQAASHKGCIKKSEVVAIFGFIRFTEGYYMVVCPSGRIVARIGCHSIHRVASFELISVYPESMQSNCAREKKYIKMFQNADSSFNMFFSYTYDLTHTLQHYYRIVNSTDDGLDRGAVRPMPEWKYSWNANWLDVAHSGLVEWCWFVVLIHGFIGSFAMEFAGQNLMVVLISRRSAKMAGTRFLKRGGDVLGNVANEVETEQIIHTGSCYIAKGKCTSFVIMRGSVPGHWSQDAKQVPLPPITFDRPDPFHTCACQHFKQVLTRHGSPILILDLVKRNEKKKREEFLSEHFQSSVQYAQQFLPLNSIYYTHYDMSSAQRSEPGVFGRLDEISKYYVNQTGFFANSNPEKHEVQFQNGITRVNCVDCLDRTNTAMYSIAKYAIGVQLQILGFLNSNQIDNDSYFEQKLRSLYEESGDTLALQYGGSQMVHNVDTYRRTSPWASQSREIVHALSRCYNNAFSDAEKQNSINLFLGVFRPFEHNLDLWDIACDQLLHDPAFSLTFIRSHCTAWPGETLWKCLPEPMKTDNFLSDEKCDHPLTLRPFDEAYKPFQYQRLNDMFDYQLITKHYVDEASYKKYLLSSNKANATPMDEQTIFSSE